jgi:hypothetical protein
MAGVYGGSKSSTRWDLWGFYRDFIGISWDFIGVSWDFIGTYEWGTK